MTSRRRIFVVAAAVAAFGGAALLAAQPAEGQDDRRRAVGDWLVEDMADPEAGRMIRVRREADEYSLEYRMLLGSSPYYGESYIVARLSCAQGGSGSIDDGRPYGDRDRVRAQLVEYLVRCELSPEEAEQGVDGFERAFALAAGWADERAAESAVSGSMDMGMEITNAVDDMGMAVEMNAADMSMDMDMDMDMNVTDMNTTIDMNWTEDPDLPTNYIEPE